jgi:hypothetical protein
MTSPEARPGQDVQASAPLTWPIWRRWLLNFGTVYLALYFLLIGQGLLPVPPQWRFEVADRFSRVWSSAPLLPTGPTGSGDTPQDWLVLLLGLLLSLVLATLLTSLQRQRPGPSPRTLSELSVGLRAALIIWLLAYGSAKFNFGQFGLLNSAQAQTTYADSSPMGLLWRFMALSPGYQYLAGVAEALPALLLLHRRTVTLGALIAVVTLTNVFALNMFYDVPVKLFSFHLLLAAGLLLAFDAPRLLSLLSGRAVPALPLARRSRLLPWASWTATALCLGFLGVTVVQGVSAYRTDRIGIPIPIKARGFYWVSDYPYNE